MKPLSCRTLFFAAGLLLAAAPAVAASAPAGPALKKAVDRFDRTKARIDALLRNRLQPEPLPASLPNPFLLTEAFSLTEVSRTPGDPPDHGAEPAGPETKTPVEAAPPGSDAELLAFYATTLKISGTVQVNGRLQLVINQSSYKEGDLILLHKKDATIYLKVVRIAPGELTLGYNGVEQVLKINPK